MLLCVLVYNLAFKYKMIEICCAVLFINIPLYARCLLNRKKQLIYKQEWNSKVSINNKNIFSVHECPFFACIYLIFKQRVKQLVYKKFRYIYIYIYIS